MEEKEKQEDLEKKDKEDKKLPHCTTATVAEHARASDGDEPCDDGRGENVNE